MNNFNRLRSSNDSGNNRRNLLNAIARRAAEHDPISNSNNEVVASLRRLNQSAIERRADELGMTVSSLHAAIDQVTVPTSEQLDAMAASEAELNAVAGHIQTLVTRPRHQVPEGIWNAATASGNSPNALVEAVLRYQRAL